MGNEKYLLKLYIVGGTSHAERVVADITRICEEELDHQYALEVVDVLEQPALAEDDQIIATPTLIKVLPEPLRRVIGDLSDGKKLLVGLGLRRADDTPDSDVPQRQSAGGVLSRSPTAGGDGSEAPNQRKGIPPTVDGAPRRHPGGDPRG